MIGGGPIMDDKDNLTVQNPSGRQPFSKKKLDTLTTDEMFSGQRFAMLPMFLLTYF